MATFSNQKQASSHDIYSSSQTITVAFQGVQGAFGDEAARAYFGQQEETRPDFMPCPSFGDVFRAVAIGEADYGVVPIENSQAGSIVVVPSLHNARFISSITLIGSASLLASLWLCESLSLRFLTEWRSAEQ